MLVNTNKYPWFLFLIVFFISGCDSDEKPVIVTAKNIMTVYKSPTCSCCEKWIEHMQGAGFDIRIEHPDDLLAIKLKNGIERDLQSCHTAVFDGYFFEGHVPADDVKRFLTEKPADAAGLSVPRMPVGSPGMEMDGRQEPYQVMLVTKQGEKRSYSQHP